MKLLCVPYHLVDFSWVWSKFRQFLWALRKSAVQSMTSEGSGCLGPIDPPMPLASTNFVSLIHTYFLTSVNNQDINLWGFINPVLSCAIFYHLGRPTQSTIFTTRPWQDSHEKEVQTEKEKEERMGLGLSFWLYCAYQVSSHLICPDMGMAITLTSLASQSCAYNKRPS